MGYLLFLSLPLPTFFFSDKSLPLIPLPFSHEIPVTEDVVLG